MLEKAIAKIKAEINSNKDNEYIKVVGEFLLQHLEINPCDAEKINQAEKTIMKSLEEMRGIASKKKVGNFAMLTPQEGFNAVLKYFGIEGAAAVTVPSPVVVSQTPIAHPVQEKKQNIDFNVELDF